MVTAEKLLKVWSHRLRMNSDGVTAAWSPALRSAVGNLVVNLKRLDPHDRVEIDPNFNSDTFARFIRAETGEIIGEIPLPAAAAEENSN